MFAISRIKINNIKINKYVIRINGKKYPRFQEDFDISIGLFDTWEQVLDVWDGVSDIYNLEDLSLCYPTLQPETKQVINDTLISTIPGLCCANKRSYNARVVCTAEKSCAAALEKGCLALVKHPTSSILLFNGDFHFAKVGEKLFGTKIKTNHYYWLSDNKLFEAPVRLPREII